MTASTKNTIGALRISEMKVGPVGDAKDVPITKDEWSLEASKAGNISLKPSEWSVEQSEAGKISHPKGIGELLLRKKPLGQPGDKGDVKIPEGSFAQNVGKISSRRAIGGGSLGGRAIQS
jgi:hypothetical protein